MSPEPLAEKYFLSALGQSGRLAIQQRGGRRAGAVAGQALGMGRRVLLWKRRTQPRTLDGDCWYIRLR